jgi:putative endonuclease
MDSRARGLRVETFALEHLERRGLRRVARNYRCRAGEIDLVMRDGDTLVFVEVRYRRRPHFGGAVESVDTRKQRRLIRAAAHYLASHRCGEPPPCRFDVVAVDGEPGAARVTWIEGAFEA